MYLQKKRTLKLLQITQFFQKTTRTYTCIFLRLIYFRIQHSGSLVVNLIKNDLTAQRSLVRPPGLQSNQFQCRGSNALVLKPRDQKHVIWMIRNWKEMRRGKWWMFTFVEKSFSAILLTIALKLWRAAPQACKHPRFQIVQHKKIVQMCSPCCSIRYQRSIRYSDWSFVNSVSARTTLPPRLSPARHGHRPLSGWCQVTFATPSHFTENENTTSERIARQGTKIAHFRQGGPIAKRVRDITVLLTGDNITVLLTAQRIKRNQGNNRSQWLSKK